MYYHLLSGSARLFMGLLAMIPKLVERVLLHVFSTIKWVCQIFHGSASHDPKVSRKTLWPVLPSINWVCEIVHGSASHDPQISRGGSARLSMGLLEVIPKSVKCGSARVLLAMIPIN